MFFVYMFTSFLPLLCDEGEADGRWLMLGGNSAYVQNMCKTRAQSGEDKNIEVLAIFFYGSNRNDILFPGINATYYVGKANVKISRREPQVQSLVLFFPHLMWIPLVHSYVHFFRVEVEHAGLNARLGASSRLTTSSSSSQSGRVNGQTSY